MKAKRLKELLATIEDDTEVFIRTNANTASNIETLAQVEMSTYHAWGRNGKRKSVLWTNP